MNPYFKEQGMTPTAALAARAKAQETAVKRRDAFKAQRDAAGVPSTKHAKMEAAKARRASIRTMKPNDFRAKLPGDWANAKLNWPKK